MGAPVAIGVDNGGTWIRFKGFNTQGHCVWSVKKPSPTVQDLPAFLRKHLKRFHGHLTHLAVGSRGVWKQAKRREVKRALRGLAKHIVVMSDVEAAWLAAFGARPLIHNRGQAPVDKGSGPAGGVVVIAGTGSIAYGRTSNGKYARAGGFGPEKGDEGSGYWIGKEWLARRGMRIHFNKRRVRDIAALAPRVLALARNGNYIAKGIVAEAQHRLADLVIQVTKKLRFKRIPVSWAGSVFDDAFFRRGFYRALHPLTVTPRIPRMDTATALARSIMSNDASG